MNDDREAFEFAYALYLARQVDREAAQMIVQAAKEGIIGIDQATEALRLLSRNERRRFADKNNT
jgi:AICAR transformylase/IMP cyclohydrolase PurH